MRFSLSQISTPTLVKYAAWGGLILSSTGFYLQHKLIDQVRGAEYYKKALSILRKHPGAVYYIGEPIKDRRFKITDSENNFCNKDIARFCVPVSGSKERGKYYFWAEKEAEEWIITKAELELKSKVLLCDDITDHTDDIKCYDLLINFSSSMSSIDLFKGTSKEKFFYHNTLLAIVKTLVGHNVTVDLRNDSYVCGYIASLDGFMNISFSNAVYCDPQGNEFSFEHLFVQARSIRYVHIPENISIISSLKKEFSKKKYVPSNKLQEKSRKAKKALQQHMQTVAYINKERASTSKINVDSR